MSEGGGTVRLERRGAVVRLTLDHRAARNALTWSMYEQLDAHLDGLQDDAAAGVVVLRGAGGNFASGTDIRELAGIASGGAGLTYERRIESTLLRLESVPVPTLAVVEGWATGAGLLLALSCDLRVSSSDARFGAPIARTVGNCLSLASLKQVVAHLGPALAREVLFLANFLDAERAGSLGLVVDVVEPERLDSRVEELCQRLLSHAPLTLTVTKRGLARMGDGKPTDDDDLIRMVYQSRDFAEGVRAFLEKRPPRWEGG